VNAASRPPREHAQDRRSEPPRDRLNWLIAAAHPERDRGFEMRAELRMKRSHPTEAVTDPRRDSLASPLPSSSTAALASRRARKPSSATD
jgi:hypothetical protein